MGKKESHYAPTKRTCNPDRASRSAGGAASAAFDQGGLLGSLKKALTDEERALVRGGGIPEDWAAKPAKLAQKDRDARWTLKRGRRKKGPDGKLMAEIATPIFGYKSHIGIERAKVKIGLANIAFNFKRFLYWETRASTAGSRGQGPETDRNAYSVTG